MLVLTRKPGEKLVFRVGEEEWVLRLDKRDDQHHLVIESKTNGVKVVYWCRTKIDCVAHGNICIMKIVHGKQGQTNVGITCPPNINIVRAEIDKEPRISI